MTRSTEARHQSPTPEEPSSEPTSRVQFLIGAGLIVAVGIAAYFTSFSGAFVFDDERILINPNIRHLWPIDNVLKTDRPILDLTLAVNYAFGGLDPRGYHALNLAVHVLAALVLASVLLHTFNSRRLRDTFGQSASGIALAVALIWVAHPLLTQAVTYVVQRGESLAGLFYLLTLHAVIRGAASRRHTFGWYSGAVAWCALGMATKPVMVTAPLVVLIYDRIFLATWRDLLARRWGLYLSMAATWSVAVYLAVVFPDPAAGFGTPLPWNAYARSQPGVILHYLKLALWPSPLVFDYGWPIAKGISAIVLPAVPIGALLVATAWALRSNAPIGFLGAWFFLILAPSSSVIPIKDLAFEHRMYLPLAAVLVFLVVAAHEALRRAPWFSAPSRRLLASACLAIVVVVLGVATSRRNLDYRSQISIWSDVLAKRPENPRSYSALGAALVVAGQDQRALPLLLEGLRRQPNLPTLLNLGIVHLHSGRPREAIALFDDVLRIASHAGHGIFITNLMALAYHNRGLALARLGRYEEAIGSYRESYRLLPGDPLGSDVGIAEALLAWLDEGVRRRLMALGRGSVPWREEFEELATKGRVTGLAIDRTYRRVTPGRRIGEIQVHLEYAGGGVHAQFGVEGEIPRPILDALSEEVAELAARSGAERVSGPVPTLAPSGKSPRLRILPR